MAKTKVGVEFRGTENGVTSNTKKINRGLNSTAATSKKVTTSMQTSWKDVAFAVGTAYLAFQQIKRVFDSLIGAYDKQVVAETKLAAALKSTGNLVKISSNSMLNMAESLQRVTTFSDQALTAAQGLLVTFTQVGREAFPRALSAATDMSAMFGQELKQSIVQLGTALNDPIRGVGRLRRIGISFTQAQKDSIKQYVQQNNLIAAQGVILDELALEFGGVAKAMAQAGTGPLKQLNNAFVDLQEDAGRVLVESMQPLIAALFDLVTLLRENVSFIEDFGRLISFVGTVLVNTLKFIIQWREAIITLLVVFKAVPAVLGAISVAMGGLGFASSAALGPIGLLIAAVTALVGVTVSLVQRSKEVEKEWSELVKKEQDHAEFIKKAREGNLKTVEDYNEAQESLIKIIEESEEKESKADKNRKLIHQQMQSRYKATLLRVQEHTQALENRLLIEDALDGVLSNYEDYNKAIDIQVQNIKSLTRELELAGIAETENGRKQIENAKLTLTAIKQQQRAVYLASDEYRKIVEERTKLEEDYAKRVFELTSTRIEIINKEEQEVLEQAVRLGADTTNIVRFYSEQRKEIAEDETASIISEYEERAQQIAEIERSSLETLNSLNTLGNQDRIQSLIRQKDESIKIATESFNALKEIYGTPFVEEIQKDGDVLLSDDEMSEIENFIKLYQQSIDSINQEYGAKIKAAQLEINKEIELGGKRGVELYEEMLHLNQNLLDPVAKQRKELNAQKDLLLELRSLLPEDTTKLTTLQKEVAENIPVLLENIEEQLKGFTDLRVQRIQTEAENIAKKYDNVFKTERDKLNAQEKALREDIKSIERHLNVLIARKAMYELEGKSTKELSQEINKLDGVLDLLDDELSETQGKIKGSTRNILTVWDFLVADITSVFTDFRDNALNRYSQTAGIPVEDLTPEEEAVATSNEALLAAVSSATGAILWLVDQFVGLITSTEIWRNTMDAFNTALIAVIEFAVVPLIDAIRPLLTVIIAFVSIIANLAVPVFNMLGTLIQALLPLFFVVGQVLIALTEVFIRLLAPVLSIFTVLSSLLLPILGIFISLLDTVSVLLQIFAPVLDIVINLLKTLLVPVAVVAGSLQWLSNVIYNFGKFVLNVINNILDASKWTAGFKDANLGGIVAAAVANITSAPTQADFAANFPDFEAIPTFDQSLVFGEDGELTTFEELTPGVEGGGVFGGGTTVTEVPDINIHQHFHAPVIGEGGSEEIGEYVVAAIQDYLGVGGTVVWLETTEGV